MPTSFAGRRCQKAVAVRNELDDLTPNGRLRVQRQVSTGSLPRHPVRGNARYCHSQTWMLPGRPYVQYFLPQFDRSHAPRHRCCCEIFRGFRDGGVRVPRALSQQHARITDNSVCIATDITAGCVGRSLHFCQLLHGTQCFHHDHGG